MVLNPQHLKVFGENISIDDYATLICAPDKRIDLSAWQTDKNSGEINLVKSVNFQQFNINLVLFMPYIEIQAHFPMVNEPNWNDG